MDEEMYLRTPSDDQTESISTVRSLKDLIDQASGRSLLENVPQEESGLAEALPYPFLALVGQPELKLALTLALINPAIGGVLLIGPRGTGKTTAVRSLLDLLPQVERSACFYGCTPEDIEQNGIDAVCPECAKKYGLGEPLTRLERVHLVELPLNTTLDEVIGGVDPAAGERSRMRLKRGILSNADLDLLYVDEINLLGKEIVDAILDAASAGTYTVRRGPFSATYHARFTLIGSMNPEEGRLRPQILDRFGLRVLVQGLQDPADRLEVYRRVGEYRQNQRAFIRRFQAETEAAQAEIENARQILPDVQIPTEVALRGIEGIQRLGVDSLRAEIALFEAARAYAASDGRREVSLADLQAVTPLALRLRRSDYMSRYFTEQSAEEEELVRVLQDVPFDDGRSSS